MARDVQITFDCADPAALAAFWAEALGYRLQDPPGGFATWDEALEAMGVPPENRNDASAVVDPDGAGPRLFFQRVPEPKRVKNRVPRPSAPATSSWPTPRATSSASTDRGAGQSPSAGSCSACSATQLARRRSFSAESPPGSAP